MLHLATGERWHPGLPKQWDAVPGSIEEFPFDAKTRTYQVDPWSYTGRLGAYKTLLNSASALHFGENGYGNPLWGLPLQFAWQHDTGRLLSQTDRINASSWWGAMNYMLSVIPFVGALESGCIHVPSGCQVKIASPPATSLVCPLLPMRPGGGLTLCK